MRIKTAISMNYVPSWGVWEAFREFAQNALDSNDKGFRLFASHDASNRLTLVNEGAVLPLSAMTLGGTSKADDDSQRGQFGEGMKLALLALLRDGIPVGIFTGDRKYRAARYWDDGLGCETLAIEVARRNYRESTEVVMDGLSSSDIKMLFERVLPFRSLPVAKKFGVTPVAPAFTLEDVGSWYDDKSMEGQLYVGGIYVGKIPDLKGAYDLKVCKLDRDRAMPDHFDMVSRLFEINKAAMTQEKRPAAELIKLVLNNAPDVSAISSGDDDFNKKMADAFMAEFPADAYVSHWRDVDPAWPFNTVKLPQRLWFLESWLTSPDSLMKKIDEEFAGDAPAHPGAAVAQKRFNELMAGVASMVFSNDASVARATLSSDNTLRIVLPQDERCAEDVFASALFQALRGKGGSKFGAVTAALSAVLIASAGEDADPVAEVAPAAPSMVDCLLDHI